MILFILIDFWYYEMKINFKMLIYVCLTLDIVDPHVDTL